MRYFIWLLALIFFSFNLTFAEEEQPFIYDDQGKRDPFLSLVDKNGRYLLDSSLGDSTAGLNLSGILWDPQGKSSALINNQIVKIGETISGFTVTDISEDSVTVLKNDETYTINVLEGKEQ